VVYGVHNKGERGEHEAEWCGGIEGSELNASNQHEVGLWVQGLIKINISGFYESKYWRRLRKEVLTVDKYECQVCKEKGFYSKANTVHHVNYVRLHPELALEKFYKNDDGVVKRNLISVCHLCHEVYCHPERLQKEKVEPLTVERW